MKLQVKQYRIMDSCSNDSNYGWTLLISIVSFERACTDQNTQQLSSLGTEFMLGVLGTRYPYPYTPERIVLNIMSASTANVHITSPFTNLDMNFRVVSFSRVNVSGEFSVSSNGSVYRGLYIQSDVLISINVISYGHYDVFEGFMALPVNVLSTEYIAASYEPVSSLTQGAELMLVGIHNATIYNISGSRLDLQNRSLHRFETVQYMSDADISGTVITSNKPIAVFSGSSSSRIPVGSGDFQHLVEQMIPVDVWGYKYIVPPLHPRAHYLIKIFSSLDNNTVLLCNNTGNITNKLDKGNTLEYLGNTDPAVVISDKPVSVIQYLYEIDYHVNGDPFMTTVQSVTQFRRSYSFATGPSYKYFANEQLTIAVTIQTSEADNLLIHDKDRNLITSFIKVGQVQDFSVLAINVTYNNFYSIEHPENTTFGLLLYGLPLVSIGFGYPVAMTFNRNDIDKSTISTETTTMSTSSTSTAVQSTTSSTPSNSTVVRSTTASTSATEKRIDIDKSTISTETTTMSTSSTSTAVQSTTSSTPSNSTVVRSTTASTSATEKRIDIDKSTISTETTTMSTSSTSTAVQSTTSSTPSTSTVVRSTTASTSATEIRIDNTTWCFDCTDMSHLKYCDKVQRCADKDQVCFVQNYMRSLNVKLYKSGCIDKKHCQTDGQADCLQCCEGSFCNTQGCGDNGINDIGNRGPVCFDCTHRGEHELCRTVQLCAPNERCIVEKYSWGADDFHYVQGCTRKEVMGPQLGKSCGLAKKSVRETNEKHTRHVPSCTKCCASDFCNSNCTETPIPAIIG